MGSRGVGCATLLLVRGPSAHGRKTRPGIYQAILRLSQARRGTKWTLNLANTESKNGPLYWLRLRGDGNLDPQPFDGATRATGTVAVIDVFRAFTTAAVALANGTSKIVMVRTVEEALALREAGVGQICMGEVQRRAPPGFDFGTRRSRSPPSISGARRSSQRTSAGTQGIVAASHAERLYAASLVTAEATVCAVLSDSRVAMGDNGIKRTDEDELCASFVHS